MSDEVDDVLTVFREEWNNWITDDIVKLAKKYPKWLRKMIIHLESDFSSAGNPIVFEVVSQRPIGFLIDLNDDQLAQYIFDVLSEYIRILKRFENRKC